jgi:hypothetical protein
LEALNITSQFPNLFVHHTMYKLSPEATIGAFGSVILTLASPINPAAGCNIENVVPAVTRIIPKIITRIDFVSTMTRAIVVIYKQTIESKSSL